MNRNEYMAALHRALSVLPDEERVNALRYYEEYFDDAGPESEQKVIADLGDPEQIAAQILADYRDLVTASFSSKDKAAPPPPKTRRGISPGLLILLVVLAIPLGIPLAAGAVALVVGILAAIFGLILAAFLTIVALPLCLLLIGIAFCAFSFVLWETPASALVTLGSGLASFALGILASALIVKLCILFGPPLFRGLVAILRWPIDKLRNRNYGGRSS